MVDTILLQTTAISSKVLDNRIQFNNSIQNDNLEIAVGEENSVTREIYNISRHWNPVFFAENSAEPDLICSIGLYIGKIWDYTPEEMFGHPDPIYEGIPGDKIWAYSQWNMSLFPMKYEAIPNVIRRSYSQSVITYKAFPDVSNIDEYNDDGWNPKLYSGLNTIILDPCV